MQNRLVSRISNASKRLFGTRAQHNNHAALPNTTGILAMEVYFPNTYVSQSKLEIHDKASTGKYTIGLGQENMAFASAKREDCASMCMTAVHNLLEKYHIPMAKIGRIEVGTETQVDKSKSVKSYVTQIFEKEGFTEFEGSDVVHACYGGTSALLNAMYWLETQERLGEPEQYALVIAGDIAVYKDTAARPTGGAGAIAMLLGRDAPIQFDLKAKGSHMRHAYDFYKPDPKCCYPVVDGKFSNTCYINAVDVCYDRFRERLAKQLHKPSISLNDIDYGIFHSPYNKLVQKSVGRLLYNDCLKDEAVLKALPFENDADREAAAAKLYSVAREDTYNDNDFQKIFEKLATPIYKNKVHNGTFMSRQLGNNYTASVWFSLASLVNSEASNLVDKRVLGFSYGSGFNSTMFMLRGRQSKTEFSLDRMKETMNIDKRIAAREEISADEYYATYDDNQNLYAKNNWASKDDEELKHILPGTYYLTGIDNKWRRSYKRL